MLSRKWRDFMLVDGEILFLRERNRSRKMKNAVIMEECCSGERGILLEDGKMQRRMVTRIEPT
jgi:hypothetical protein